MGLNQHGSGVARTWQWEAWAISASSDETWVGEMLAGRGRIGIGTGEEGRGHLQTRLGRYSGNKDRNGVRHCYVEVRLGGRGRRREEEGESVRERERRDGVCGVCVRECV